MPTHSETRILPYPRDRLYELVSDVEDYPNFLPWCLALRVLDRSEQALEAEMLVGFRMIRERYVSRITLSPTDRIDVECLDGPFDRLRNRWRFRSVEGGCEVDFFIDFEFRSRLLRAVAGPVFHEETRRLVRAFERRAVERCPRDGAPRQPPGFRGAPASPPDPEP